MEPYKFRIRLALFAAIGVLISSGALLAADRSTEGKKVVIFEGPLRDDFFAYFQNQSNSTAIDGVTVDFSIPGREDLRDEFFNTNNAGYSPGQFAARIADWKKLQAKLPGSLLRLNVGNLNADWFDDNAWDTLLAKAKVLSSFVADAGLRGYFFDTEQYVIRPCTYAVQRHCNTKSFEQYQGQARKRGRQLMEALASAKPDVTVIYTMAHSFAAQELVGGMPLERGAYGLLPAFIDGMMEAGPKAEFFDGYEGSYSYKTHKQYADAARYIRKEGKKLSLVPELYAKKMKVGFGIWPQEGEELDVNTPLGGFAPLDLEYALHYALMESDGLVWLYMGRTYDKWWKLLPEEYIQAVAKAWGPHKLDHQPSVKAAGPTYYVLGARARPEVKDEVAFFHLRNTYSEVLDLPLKWKFKLDPNDIGEKDKWFRADHKGMPGEAIRSNLEADWNDIEIREWWQPQGYLYSGIAWYRVNINVPKIDSTEGMILAFGSVDEEAWVWVNGEFAGKHAVGPNGWQQAFEIPVGKLIRPGQANQITVRVYDSAGVGGIWKGVKLMAPKINGGQEQQKTPSPAVESIVAPAGNFRAK